MKSWWHWKDDTAALQAGSDKQQPTALSGPRFEQQYSRGTHARILTCSSLWLQGTGSCRKGCQSPHTRPRVCWSWYLQRSTASTHQAAPQTNCSVSAQFECVEQSPRAVFSSVNTNLVPRKDAASVWRARIQEKLVYLGKISSDNMD